MLNIIRKLFPIKQSLLKFTPTDEGWFLTWAKSRPKDEVDTFTWASQLPDQQMGQALYLAQLVTEEMASLTGEGLLIPWSNIYKILSDTEHSGLIDSLKLPEINNSITPIIDSKKSLSDHDFEIMITGWKQEDEVLKDIFQNGAILNWNRTKYLIPESCWELVHAFQQFSDRDNKQRSQDAQEMSWGKLRLLATKANTSYASRYLKGTIILTPETLKLDLEKIEDGQETVIQVSPHFEDAPDDWLNRFDFHNNIHDKYSFSTSDGLSQVILTEPVKRVLNVIKRDMPKRRVIGKKAEAFIRNPYALLGDEAHSVINEKDFFKEKEKLGALQNDWRLKGVSHEKGLILSVDLIIEKETELLSEKFHSPKDFSDFLDALHYEIENQSLSYHWKNYRLSLEYKARKEWEQGKRILNVWKTQKTNIIGFEEIYDLSQYGDRIVAIGEENSIVLPILLKPTGGEAGWSPDMQPAILVNLPDSHEPLLIPATKEFLEQLQKNINSAEQKKSSDVELPVLFIPIKINEAEHVLSVLKEILISPPSSSSSDSPVPPKKKPQTLIISTNFEALDYIEQRKQRLTISKEFSLAIPKNLRKEIVLKTHQEEGLRWLQFLSSIKEGCHGALLADDMGLGKTLQLLCLLAEYYQNNPDGLPSMIVAPVTLLDNWEQEIEKFFDTSFPQTLRLHSNNLKKLKQPRELIENQLLEEGITNLLQTKWLGNAKIVITTYETVRDYEFSLARQDFEFLICDEAQKIKNPRAMATLAIKKQKARFKIACTGTPVENNLVDLWCLFDWMQPSLLGTIQEFHSQYRRPIEVKTKQEAESIEELRNLIEPQVLRRMKTDISGDLPIKHEKYNRKILCENSETSQKVSMLGIDMVKYQEDLYQDTITRLNNNSENFNAKDRVKNTWALLHKIKAICAEPYCLPGLIFKPDSPLSKHLNNSPKLKWLLSELDNIQKKEEKVIIFTELRQVQNALSYFIKQKFNIVSHIVNGQTKRRQYLIDQFQAIKGFNVIILSPLAAGAGLNIVGANHVIHFTRTWNPAKESQATDRAYRIGQKKDVWVYCPTVISTNFVTFEQKLDLLMRRKSGLADDMLNGIGGDFTPKDFVKPSHEKAKNTPFLTIEDVDQLDGHSFEVFCQLLLQKEKWTVQLTEKTGGDGGVDLIAWHKNKGLLIQCKKSGIANKKLGWDAIKEVVGGAALYEKRHKNINFKKMVITNQYFNSTAKTQAQANMVNVWEKGELQKRLIDLEISRDELDSLLFNEVVACYHFFKTSALMKDD